jgi:hypothetical protein
MTVSQNKADNLKKGPAKPTSTSSKDLETQMPLSEKDEVKKAESRMNKTPKKS